MANDKPNPSSAPDNQPVVLETGTYEILRNRLTNQSADLRKKLEQLNTDRKAVFGAIDTALITTVRISTDNNSVASDMLAVAGKFIFGYNVHFGLKAEIEIQDVFSIYRYENQQFVADTIDLINDPTFVTDFKNLYRYYKQTKFLRFISTGVNFYMIFQIGKASTDIKTFKWAITPTTIRYLDNRSDHEVKIPEQYEFQWKRTTREQHVKGMYPHISIEDKIFVETIGGDLTIKVENNTDTGEGIYAEKVENKDQILDDAEIFYAILENIIILKIRPFQEKKFRFIVYNTKLRQAQRIDSLENSCILLPDGHGIIFANGYYLQTGEYKLFDHQADNIRFENRIASPHGEDYLYVFYNSGLHTFVLLSYNIIEQTVETPLHCRGFTFIENGELCCFKADDESKRHHAIQIWQTSFTSPNYELPITQTSDLFVIGNKDIVKAMAECTEVLAILNKDDTYLDLYLDVVKKTTDIIDTYHWINNPAAYHIAQSLTDVRQTASTAIDEYEKVTRIRKATNETMGKVLTSVDELMRQIIHLPRTQINDFVQMLTDIRTKRGEVISLKELRYADLSKIEKYENLLAEQNDKLSQECVQFLLHNDALQPYRIRVDDLQKSIDTVAKVVDANKLEETINQIATELEMLIDIVSNLKIEDATQTARIIESITSIYANFNQMRAALRRKRRELASLEGKTEFAAQLKLISQAVTNFIDLSETPQKADEYLNKIMVQLEEIEGKFADFEEFVEQVAEKREEIYAAFETKKIQLIEALSKRSNNLLQSADRIMKAIQNRLVRFENVTEINGYFASDLMVEKLNDTIRQLLTAGDSVKADDVASKLKTIKEDAIRQLIDKNELYVKGENVIKFGTHHFNVNTQPFGLTTVISDNSMFFQLTGTGFSEKIHDTELEKTRSAWNQSVVSENEQVSRAEYLAYKIFDDANKHLVRFIDNSAKLFADVLNADKEANHEIAARNITILSLNKLHSVTDDQLLEHIRTFMSQRFDEGYVRGIHDNDAFIILKAILQITKSADLLRYPSQSRACAELFWRSFLPKEARAILYSELKGLGAIMKLFPNTQEFGAYVNRLDKSIHDFVEQTELFDSKTITDAGEYLFYEKCGDDVFVIDHEAANLYHQFVNHLKKKNFTESFEKSVAALADFPVEKYRLVRNWLRAFVGETVEQLELAQSTSNIPDNKSVAQLEQYRLWYNYIDETAVTIFSDSLHSKHIIKVTLSQELTGLQSIHPEIVNQTYRLNFNAFMHKLKHFEAYTVPLFRHYSQIKTGLIKNYEKQLRLNEFKPRVLTSFVRNKLIDQVYLPLIGSNLAKQMGTAGDTTRTDRMGMLLLISPPGYGKTTLMEYVASRLGVIFMKINGPAIGHEVTSLDPLQAKNRGAIQEIEKLNLGFEMGDNVMIYLDDIQHLHPEFLQKFISLADAQRKIEGIYKGQTKTYDFRGKKVSIVMAGNPYTESGDKFKIPDMLANRADIYNLGDIIGNTEQAFLLSYIENSLTSNQSLSKLVNKSFNDLYTLIKLAETNDKQGAEFEANHSQDEITEYVTVLKKLFTVRNIVYKVNKQYIYSAGQADEYRTEPAFKLQGSYRNMNKLTERVSPVMNDAELMTVILSHYENEAQTLTTGAEANFLKFKELIGVLTESETNRWNEIKSKFQQQQRLKGYGNNQQIGEMLLQVETIAQSLDGIKIAIERR